MLSQQLPLWFPLDKKLSSEKSTFEESEWKKLIYERIEVLGINGEKKFDKIKGETSTEFRERASRDILAHKLLNLAVCLNPRFSAWFVENEGDLFSYRFERLKWSDKIGLLNYLYGSNLTTPSWLELEELNLHLKEDLMRKLNLPTRRKDKIRTKLGSSYKIEDVLGNNKIIAINYKYVSFLLKHRRVMIYKGWAIDSLEKFSSSIKHQYENLLNQELNKSAERLENSSTQLRTIIEDMTNLLIGLIKPQTKSFGLSEFVVEGDFDSHLNLYPPCIRDLAQTVDKVGYIPHWERFQLGLFLKHTGMDVEDQLNYWYSKAVDNIGMTYEQFIKRAGYVIRHIYGLVGGKINYEMPSCTTIQDKMYCTFRHTDISTIGEVVNKLFEIKEESKIIAPNPERILNKILEFTGNGFPNQACASFLSLFKSHKLPQIKHPMIYLKIAGEGSGILKEISDSGERNDPKS